MRIAIGCDDIGFPLKGVLIQALESGGHVVLDLGSFSAEPVDYPDYARVVGQAVLRGFAEGGVLVCGSGVGAAIAANKLRSVRAAFCPDAATARESREQLNSNVLCLQAGALDPDAAVDIALAWIETSFSDDEADARRVTKIAQLEESQPAGERASTAPAGARSPSPAMAAAPPAARGGTRPPTGPGRTPVEPPPAPVQAAPPVAASRRARQIPDALSVPAVEQTLALLESQGFLDRLWNKDASLWKGEASLIESRLGWLTAPTVMRSYADDLRAFADESRRLHFSQVAVLETGGAAPATEVWSRTFGSKMGFPDLLGLDSTHPAVVRRALDRMNVPRTLFVVSSKSGTTPETLALYAFFRGLVDANRPPTPGMQFVAVTDPGTPLDALAREDGFRHTFLNSDTVAGPYSALSFSGLVPAALIGVDIRTLLERARAMAERCGASARVQDSPAVRLGAALAALGKAGRDKVTLVLSERIRPLGAWLEQVLAESLGKDGKGLVPVVDEPLGPPAAYGADRLFAAITLEGDDAHDAALAALADAGHPVIRIELADPLDVGGEFFRWQLAAATAAAVLGVNPFDAPEAARGAESAAALHAQAKRTRRLPEWGAAAEEDGLALMTRATPPPTGVVQGFVTHVVQAQPGDYLALQAYLDPTPEVWSALQALRTLLRDRLRIATTLGLGPRYLHAAGQLHKGGPPGGLFVQITGEDEALPGAGADLSALTAAQALADLDALHQGGRRVIRLHLTGKPVPALERLLQTVRMATRRL